MNSISKLKIYINNSLWLFSEKVVSLLVAFSVSAYLARTLGPAEFGSLSYLVAVVGLVSILGHMGLSGIFIKEIVSNKNQNEIIGTSIILKMMGYGFSILLICVYAITYDMHSSTEKYALIIISMSLLFRPIEIFEFIFSAKMQNKYSVISKQIACVAGGIIKVIGVSLGGGILLVAYAVTVQALIGIMLIVYFALKKDMIEWKKWRWSNSKGKELILRGWPVFLGTILSIVYLKIDVLMIKGMLGNEQAGIYSVASTISEVWYFIPVAITAAVFPRLIEQSEYNKEVYRLRLQQLLDFMLVLALVLSIFICYFSEKLIFYAFGNNYMGAVVVLDIHIWASLFIFMRAVLSRWIIIENHLWYSVYTHGGGAIVNVVLNYLWIDSYGVIGAAYATLIAYAAASYVSLIFLKKGHGFFWMMTKSFFVPVRGGIFCIRYCFNLTYKLAIKK